MSVDHGGGGGVSCYEIALNVASVWEQYTISVKHSNFYNFCSMLLCSVNSNKNVHLCRQIHRAGRQRHIANTE